MLSSYVHNESYEIVANWFRTSVFPWCLSIFLCGTYTFCHLSGTLCLCCGMKGSVVWKRCVWNPCCLERVRGHRVRKRTSFYSWHGSLRNATLGRRHPPFTDSLALSSYPAFFGLSPSLPRGTWLTAKTAGSLGSAWCSIWFVLFGTMKVKMLSVTGSLWEREMCCLCRNKMAHRQTFKFPGWHHHLLNLQVSWSCLTCTSLHLYLKN